MSYRNKHLKYKKKFLSLKREYENQRGGLIINNFDTLDEIHFWGRQSMEHAFIMFISLTEETLKSKAWEIHLQWKKFLENNYYNTGINVDPKTVFLTKEDLNKLNRGEIYRQINYYVELIETFFIKLKNIIDEGIWIGLIYPAFLDHMIMETAYFKRKINGPPFSIHEEIKIINHHHSDEMGETAQMIDPSPNQQGLIDLIRSYTLKNMTKFKEGNSLTSSKEIDGYPKEWHSSEEEILKKWSYSKEEIMNKLSETDKDILTDLDREERETIIAISIKFSDELTEFSEASCQKVESRELKGIISPAIAYHVYRELVRFTKTLKKIPVNSA